MSIEVVYAPAIDAAQMRMQMLAAMRLAQHAAEQRGALFLDFENSTEVIERRAALR